MAACKYRAKFGIDKLAAARGGMQVLRGNSGSDKLTAAGAGMQVQRGKFGTDKQTAEGGQNRARRLQTVARFCLAENPARF